MIVCCLPTVSGMLFIGADVLRFAKFSHCIFSETPSTCHNLSHMSKNSAVSRAGANAALRASEHVALPALTKSNICGTSLGFKFAQSV